MIIPLQEYFIYRMIAEKQRYGREIILLSQKYLSEDAKIPTIYGLLKKGEDDGLLEITYFDEAEGITRGNPRKYYQLTKAGLIYFGFLEREIEALSQIRDVNTLKGDEL